MRKVILVLAVALAACGGSVESASTTTSSASGGACPPDDACVRWYDSGDAELGCVADFATAGVSCEGGVCDGEGYCEAPR